MIEINNLTSFTVDKKLFTGIAKKVLKGENKEREKISLAFVNKKEMQKLNKKFRGKNKATDVLSFGLKDPPSPKASDGQGKDYLGEIVICPEMVKPDKSSKEHFDPLRQSFSEASGPATIPAERDLARVFVHGILHLLGYDHEKSERELEIMEKKEKHYLSIL
ncbi:MAG: rRNA maturation RNase YbeY [Patescibacteria group bacterium]